MGMGNHSKTVSRIADATVLLFACLAVLVAPLTAQSGLQRRSAEEPAYALGPGDRIVLTVADMDDLPTGPVVIDPSGVIDLPLTGTIHAGGLTIPELKLVLADKLRKFITNPDISINLVASGSQPVTVIGEVNAPGVHQLSGSDHLLEVLSLSGGLKPDAGPMIIVTRQARWGAITGTQTGLTGKGVTSVSFSVDDLLSATDPQANILMRPDDVVSIPRAELIYVVGDVKKAGGFPLSTHPTISLLQAVSLAEGLGPNNAAGKARILRPTPGGDGKPREIPVDINKIFAGKSPDVSLRANDVLFVPKSGVKVTSQRLLDAALGVAAGVAIYR
jgi:polysaccharide export outer membrane protein